MNILEKNYADPQFGVKDLTERLNISYTVIYKKFVSLTGLPPVRFIQLYRLQIAKKILESSTNNVIVSEIAYRVGFNDPKYFTRCFVKQYKQTPSSFSSSITLKLCLFTAICRRIHFITSRSPSVNPTVMCST